MVKAIFLLPLAVLLGACQAVPPDGEAGTATASPFERDTPEWRGLKFARNRCSDCHAVEPNQTSPNPTAPGFEQVANTPGLTSASLKQWLADVHNYPDAMYFEIPAEHIDDLTAYLLTLRREDYRPPI